MPNLENVRIRAWKYGNNPGYIDLVIEDDQGHQRHLFAKEEGCCKLCTELHKFIEARFEEIGYPGPASAES